MLYLRKRVLAACDVGEASRVVARQYQVSRTWINQLKQRQRETGELGPRRPQRFKPSVLAGHMEQLRAWMPAPSFGQALRLRYDQDEREAVCAERSPEGRSRSRGAGSRPA